MRALPYSLASKRGTPFALLVHLTMHSPRLLLSAALAVACASIAQAQPALDRIVGRTESGTSLIVTALNGAEPSGFWRRLPVLPMGFEGAPRASLQPWTIAATGMTLRAVLDAIVAADSRYDSREDDGVVVLRPALSWQSFGGVLDNVIAPITLQDMQVVDAVSVVVELFSGRGPNIVAGPGDTNHFSVNMTAGSLIAGLNGIVRAHGTMAWTLEQKPLRRAEYPMTLSLFVGANGSGVGVRRDGVVQRGPLRTKVYRAIGPAA